MIRVKNPNYVDRLPDEYQEVEYLESTGTQYIDTGIMMAAGYTVKMNFIDTGLVENRSYFGNMQSQNKKRFRISDNNKTFAVSLLNSSNYYSDSSYSFSSYQMYEIELCAKNGEQYFSVNGEKVYTANESALEAASYNSAIFGICNNGVFENFSAIKLYYLQILYNDILIREYIPCYRKSDNIPGLYDLVNNQFYTNAGTGTFLIGKDINKKDVNIIPTYQIRKINNIIDYSNFSLSEATFENNIFTHSASNVAMVSQTLPTPILGHKYYGRCMQKTPSGYTFGDGRFEYYCADIAGTGLLTFGTMQDTGDEWRILSSIQELTGEPEEGTWQLRSFSVSGSHEAYRKELMIIDLTAAFGIGKEPTKEWCDENIPFFIGEYIMPSNWESNGETINVPLKNRYVGGKLIYGEPLMDYEYRYVTVGENGQSYYSIDGETWNSMTGATKTLNSVTYGNDRFVAVGDSGKSYYSIDGESWTVMGAMPGSSLTGNNYYSVAYGNNHFVAVGDSGLICYSTDGETWTSATGQTTGVFAYREVIYANNRFVVVGESSYGSYSLNGETWTSMKGLANEMHYGLTYGNDMFVCSSGPILDSHYSYYCQDGINWIKGNKILPANLAVQDLAYGNEIFVAIGGNGSSAYSTDGINWIDSNITGTGTFYGLTFADSKFICVGYSGNSFYSIDGINWIAMTGLSDNVFYDVSYQRKTVPKQLQLVNYTMLYDYGNECEEVTGGWVVNGGVWNSFNGYSMKVGGTAEKLSTCLHLSQSGTSGSYQYVSFATTNKINITPFVECFIKYNSQKVVSGNTYARLCFASDLQMGDLNVNKTHTWVSYAENMHTNIGEYASLLLINTNDSAIDTIEEMNDSYYIVPTASFGSSSDGRFDICLYNMTFFLEDDWQTLSEKAGISATSLDDILTNSATLLSNKEAVEFMIYNCTGEFMVKAVTSSTFLTALNNSEYATLVYANEHWNKFLAMVA